VAVTDTTTHTPLVSQVTAQFLISSNQAPYYDFELAFEATIPPASSKQFLISPSVDATCGGGNKVYESLSASHLSSRASMKKDDKLVSYFVRHANTVPDPTPQECEAQLRNFEGGNHQSFEERVLERAKLTDYTSGNPEEWEIVLAQARDDEIVACRKHDSVTSNSSNAVYVYLTNDFINVTINTQSGIQSITDLTSIPPTKLDIKHDLWSFPTTYDAAIKGPGDSYTWSPSTNGTKIAGEGPKGVALASTVAQGPVMEECWMQLTSQLKTRVRVWKSNDPDVGRRVEIGQFIGVLQELTGVVSRFTVPAIAEVGSSAVFVSEDNGYEKINHAPGNPKGNPALNMFPSQASAFIATAPVESDLAKRDHELQLSVALDRSKGVMSLTPGTLDIMQHRRGLPFIAPKSTTVVLDDIDRIFTQMYVSLGEQQQANRDRIVNKLRLNNPLQLFFSKAETNNVNETFTKGNNLKRSNIINTTSKLSPGQSVRRGLRPSIDSHSDRTFSKVKDLNNGTSFPALAQSLHLQSMRALSTDGLAGGVLVRVRHMYSAGEDVDMSKPQVIDVLSLFGGIAKNATEVTLTGLLPLSELHRNRFPVQSSEPEISTQKSYRNGHGQSSVSVNAFELRTFLVSS
jgi:hypothetical protein